MMRIGAFAALPQEYTLLKKLTGPWRSVSRRPFPTFLWSAQNREIFLIETGMGRARIGEALDWFLEKDSPSHILSIGFAGSLSALACVGDVFFGERFLSLNALNKSDTKGPIDIIPSPALRQFSQDHHVRRAQIITAERPQSKLSLSHSFKAANSLLDMESYFVASFALKKGIPFVCFRGVSDVLEDEIDFSLDAIMDSTGRVRISRVLAAALKNPWLVKSFYGSWKRARRAAQSLGAVLADLLNLPDSAMDQLFPERFVPAETTGKEGLPAGRGNSLK